MESAQGCCDPGKRPRAREILGWTDRDLADNGEPSHRGLIPSKRAHVIIDLYQALHAYGRKICMDSTHNTGRGFSGEKIYLYSLVLRNKQTGGLVPGAWMLSNSEQQ